jgi:glycolate oxidase FAD binding subunit
MDIKQAAQFLESCTARSQSVMLQGSNSKAFFGRSIEACAPSVETLSVSEHSGIIHYEPTELVVQVRSGTRLADVTAVLEENGQMFAFDPTNFGGQSTIGGMVSAGLSGSRRPYAGSVRDFVLGVEMLSATGELINFGGQVMKNVAGYDVSRLLVGSLGCLGLITNVSFKVLPKPEFEMTQRLEMSRANGLLKMRDLVNSPLVSATAHFDGQLMIRLSGSAQSVYEFANRLGGELVATEESCWHAIDSHSIFPTDKNLWRLSTAPMSPLLLDEAYLIDWGGAQRWLLESDRDIRAEVDKYSSATLVRQTAANGLQVGEVFQPLSTLQKNIHISLKSKFDPAGILNAGRMYSWL